MIRISGVDIPDRKKIFIAITYIFGIGSSIANIILEKSSIDKNKMACDLTDHEVSQIRSAMDTIKVEGDLRKYISMNIKRLIDINCYRGIRHRKGLTVRGQSTHSNAKTCKKRKLYKI